jgi:hypothetical protein
VLPPRRRRRSSGLAVVGAGCDWLRGWILEPARDVQPETWRGQAEGHTARRRMRTTGCVRAHTHKAFSGSPAPSLLMACEDELRCVVWYSVYKYRASGPQVGEAAGRVRSLTGGFVFGTHRSARGPRNMSHSGNCGSRPGPPAPPPPPLPPPSVHVLRVHLGEPELTRLLPSEQRGTQSRPTLPFW